MNQREDPNGKERDEPYQMTPRSFLFLISLLPVAAVNFWLYQHSRSLELQFRRSFPAPQPWTWPEQATGWFIAVWFLLLIAGGTVALRTTKKSFKYEAVFIVAAALVGIAANGVCFIQEAFTF